VGESAAFIEYLLKRPCCCAFSSLISWSIIIQLQLFCAGRTEKSPLLKFTRIELDSKENRLLPPQALDAKLFKCVIFSTRSPTFCFIVSIISIIKPLLCSDHFFELEYDCTNSLQRLLKYFL
jgi:hypothetical protein